MKLTPLEPQQTLNLVNTDQVYRAWLHSRRYTLAVTLRRHASRNRRVGLGTIPPLIAQELRQMAQEGTAITSYHALYAYAIRAGAQLTPLDLRLPVTTTLSQAAHPVVCIDQFGFAVLLHVLDPIIYLTHADPVSAQTIRSMIDNRLVLPRFLAQIRS